MVAIQLDKMASMRTLMFMMLFCTLLTVTIGSPIEKHERHHQKDGKFQHRSGQHHNSHKNLANVEEEKTLHEFLENNDARKEGKHHHKYNHQNIHNHKNLAKAMEEETMVEFLEKNGIDKEEFLKYVSLKASHHRGQANFVMPRKVGNCPHGTKMDPLGMCRPVWSA